MARRRAGLVPGLTALLLVAAAPATAQERPAAPLRGGTDMWTLFASYGVPQEINRSAGDVQILTAGLRWSHLWSARGPAFLRGHPAFALELLPLMTFYQEKPTYGFGFNLLYEHHFAARGRVLPVWRIGAGALRATDPVPAGETRHNFSLLTGLGLRWLVARRVALEFEYRFHHVSNADTGFRNPGINAHTASVGLTFLR